MAMITRFAPSPTGYLHLGHVYSALRCQELVKGRGECLLRFEDIDFTRVRNEFYEATIEDLRWLGMEFLVEPWRQIDRMERYKQALEDLISKELVYPCYCTRKDLVAEQDLSAPQGEQLQVYSGKCRNLSPLQREAKGDTPFSWRLNAEKVSQLVGELSFTDSQKGSKKVDPSLLGDVIVARKDIQTSYHIAVVVDDAEQGVTDIVRGEDLYDSTHVHRLLQAVWGYPEPQYHHHRLVCDKHGKRLAKRHDALSVRAMRESGMSQDEVIAQAYTI